MIAALSGLDIVFIIVVVFAAVRGTIRGFVHEFLSMAGVCWELASPSFFPDPLLRIFNRM